MLRNLPIWNASIVTACWQRSWRVVDMHAYELSRPAEQSEGSRAGFSGSGAPSCPSDVLVAQR